MRLPLIDRVRRTDPFVARPLGEILFRFDDEPRPRHIVEREPLHGGLHGRRERVQPHILFTALGDEHTVVRPSTRRAK